MKTAVIKAGGRQFVVHEGDKVVMDRLPLEEGAKTVFSEVLLLDDGKKTELGAPVLAGVSVEATVIKQARHKKIHGVKMKAKKRNVHYFGHKQHYTEVEIGKIVTKAAK
ncbi:MAG: 50S ribosomal protein L21 [Candidatus Andersenbacteria bacterium]|nr:50S ribosomal protein L21 [Candidatus Andersenbacteria bacterium]